MQQTIRNIFSLIILSLFFSAILFSQEAPPPPIKWGEINISDLQKTTFPSDTNASAVVLCDYGESSLNDYMNFVFKRHLRVKILKESGYSWGNESIVLYTDRKDGETIDDIEGITYTLDEKGKIVETEFDDDDVFEEKVSDTRTRYKWTLPGLKPGCIIDMRYEITARNLYYVRDWPFQHSEPVIWSEYRFIFPPNLGFAFLTKGFEPFAVNEKSGVLQYFSGEAKTFVGRPLVTCNLQRFVVRNAPALRDEPFITTLNDYYNKVEVQFSGYSESGSMTVSRFVETWDKLVEKMLENNWVGKRIGATAAVEDLTQKITASAATPEAKVQAIYSWITSNIVWSGVNSVYAPQSVNELLESKKGNSADITVLLISMLRAAGFQSDPVILSTRENGKIQDLYPILAQFNYLIARVNLGKKAVYLDATNPLRPWDLLPSKVLGVKALVIQPDKVEWVRLESQIRSVNNSFTQLTLDQNGAVTGTIEGIYKNYFNVSVRGTLKDKKDIETAKEYFSTEAAGLTVDSVEVKGRDTVSQPIKLKAWVSSSSFAQTGENIIYVNPHIVERIKDNPFKSPERKFPIDYTYPREYSSTVQIMIPADYQIKEGLRNVTMNVGGGVTFRRLVQVDSLQIQVVAKLEIATTEIAAGDYVRMKELYGNIVALESEQLVLEKRPAPIPPPVVEQPKPVPPAPKKKTKK
ncbi:MAG: DUF3857 and transglutaminase domain-containing protein [Bacteroidota bacterium]